ncbi:hypothetical protein ACH4E7_37510 [Kitasatospora sp. NPDC018058]|uniref:hypothetical protein n=1 Tax=Kitasatospora sp. NPDC018058 TaxID=3364025 RepID=UPI0037BE576D
MVTLRIQGFADQNAEDHPQLPETACIRFVALLPPQWRWRQSIGESSFTLDVLLDEQRELDPARATVDRAFRDPGLRGWTWAH